MAIRRENVVAHHLAIFLVHLAPPFSSIVTMVDGDLALGAIDIGSGEISLVELHREISSTGQSIAYCLPLAVYDDR